MEFPPTQQGMSGRRLKQLRAMGERGTIRKAHVLEMLGAIEIMRGHIHMLGDFADMCVKDELGGDVCEMCRCGKLGKPKEQA